MMKLLRPLSVAIVATALAGWPGSAFAGKPNIMESCKVCHKEAAEQTIRGKMVSVSEAFKSFNVTVGPAVWIVKYDDKLKVKQGEKFSGPEALKTIKKDHEIFITYTGEESKAMATQLAVKQPFKVPAEQQITLNEMKDLVAQGPEKGKYTLLDSRPPAMYAEGHMPGARSLPFAKFADLAPKLLPADKAALVIFYCAGET